MADSHLGDVSVPGSPGTAVPIREQFRCRRLWFFHHDMRAFTTSWLPLPVFAIYRVLLALYVVVWLILHIVARRDEFGPLWLIFITDLGYALLACSTVSIAILCVAYTIAHYCHYKNLLHHIPRRDFPIGRIYKQDNIPWYVKIVWLLYIVACSSAVIIFVGYWAFTYDPCPAADPESSVNATDSDMDSMMMVTTDTEQAGSGSTEQLCSFIDVHTVQVHGINVVIVLLDLILSRVPYQFFHFLYSPLYTTAYIIFSLIYWGAGGRNHNDQPFIYSVLDYGGSPTSFAFALVMIFSPMVAFLVLFLLAWLRDVISTHISCCFRDVSRLPYRDAAEIINGRSEEEMTKI